VRLKPKEDNLMPSIGQNSLMRYLAKVGYQIHGLKDKRYCQHQNQSIFILMTLRRKSNKNLLDHKVPKDRPEKRYLHHHLIGLLKQVDMMITQYLK
jgi:hypothetical protein